MLIAYHTYSDVVRTVRLAYQLPLFAVKWEILVSDWPKMITQTPFLTPHLDTQTPKDIVTKRGEDTSETQLYYGWLCGTVVECRSDRRTFVSCARPGADR